MRMRMNRRRGLGRYARLYVSTLAWGALLAAVGGVGWALDVGNKPADKVYRRVSDAEIRKHVDRECVRRSAVNELLDY